MTTTSTDPAVVAAAEAEAKAKADAAARAAAEAAKAPKFSQEDLDHHIAQARLKARESGVKELLETLGVTDLEAAKTTIAAAKAAEEAQKTDLQKAQDAAVALAQELEKEKSRSAQVLVATKLEGALRDAGCNTARIASALKLADRSLLKVTGETVEGLVEAVAAIKADSPEWFGVKGSAATAPDASIGGTTAPGTDVLEGMTALERKAYYREHFGIRL